MVTGDYHHTAVAVAKDVGMVKPDRQVVVIDTVRHDHKHGPDTPLSETPDSAPSREPHTQHIPTRVSFRAQPAVHECSITPHNVNPRVGTGVGGSGGVGSTAQSELRLANNWCAQDTQGSKQPHSPPQLLLGGCHPSLSARPSESPDQQQPSALGAPHTEVSSVVAVEPAAHNSPCGVPWQPLEGATPRPPSHGPPRARRSQIKLQPLVKKSEAGASVAPLPTKGKVSFEQAPFVAHCCPSRLSFEGPPPSRQLSRVSSLTRLPSEAASLLTATEPLAALDDSSLSRQHLNRQKSILTSSSKLLQGSIPELLLPFQTDSRGESTPARLLSLPQLGPRGLTFTCGAGRQHVDPCDALRAMAEGSMQCAVTGDAFEVLLQLREACLLETVLRNAVVFSRMQPHQKGQVMDLLGSRGIHQPNGANPRHIQGLGNTTVFCGDGINDLQALAAADVGVSIGTGEAFIAASISIFQPSVSGKALHTTAPPPTSPPPYSRLALG
ncbi:hypothetical protein ABBQ32_011303 [Trebouxia sp. C0010 RCD-2024]